MHRRARRLAIALAAFAAVLVAGWLALDPLVTWWTRRALAKFHGMRATFADVEVDVLALSVTIRALRVNKAAEGDAQIPFVEVERTTFAFHGLELLRGRAVASADLDAPTLNVVEKRRPKPSPPPGEPQQFEEAPKEGRGLARLLPFRVVRTQVRRGQIRLVRASAPEAAILRIHEIELVLDDLAAGAGSGAPMMLTARATLQRSGRISVFATADPSARRATFAGQGRLTGLKFAELGEIVAERSGIEPDRGTLAMIVRFEASDGRISGEVRPILVGAGTRPAHGGIAAHVKSMLADSALDVVREDVRGGADPEATQVPILGTVKDADARPVPTIIGVLRNAFVAGLTVALRGPPPAQAKERARTQAREGKLSPPPPRRSRASRPGRSAAPHVP